MAGRGVIGDWRRGPHGDAHARSLARRRPVTLNLMLGTYHQMAPSPGPLGCRCPAAAAVETLGI